MSPGAEVAHDFRVPGTKVFWPDFVGASTGSSDSDSAKHLYSACK